MKKQDFTVLKIGDLHPFPDNPFRVVEDDMLMELAESIKEFGMVTPIITRPKEDGQGYEIIAGQRRVRASELAGIDTVPAFVLPLDRDRAIITLVDSNIQRENVLPSERAFAYKMKLEAMKRQGFRTDLTSAQLGQKLSHAVRPDALWLPASFDTPLHVRWAECSRAANCCPPSESPPGHRPYCGQLPAGFSARPTLPRAAAGGPK